MFEKENSLPYSKRWRPINDGYVQADRQHRRLDMGRHVIRTLICVGQIGHFGVGRGRHQAVEKVFQIGLHFRVGVFLNEKRCRSVLDKQSQQPVRRNPIAHLFGEFVKTGAIGGDGEGCVHE